MSGSSGGVQPPSMAALFGSHATRLDRVERKVDLLSGLDAASIKDRIVFSGGPGLAVSSSGLDHARVSGTLAVVILLLSAAPSADTTVHWLLNGTALTPAGAGSPDMVVGAASPSRSGYHYARYGFIRRIAGSNDPLNADICQVALTTVDSTTSQVLSVIGLVV